MVKKLLLLLALVAPGVALAQGTATVSGHVTDDGGAPLPGATVVLLETSFGTATDADGAYSIPAGPAGTYTVAASYVGYGTVERELVVGTGLDVTADFVLSAVNAELEAVSVFARRAVDRRTPVAFTDVPKEQIQQQLGSRDLPLVLNTAPSVYATESGGGAGDARINVRGFDQRNTAVMVNGVPINDMENGWVYWSNWDGLGDAATSIQLQRGLSAVNLAAPSVGGTLNIITDPAALDAGVILRQEVGSAGFLKTTATASTGLLNERFAATLVGVRKMGNGLVDGTWTDAWAYYGAASLRLGRRNTLALYAVGAPQRHGQNLFRQNIAVYDTDFALGLDDYDPAALQANGGLYNEAGWDFNQNVAPVSPGYDGLQAAGDDTFERYDEEFLNERENFFHKPQINLNWYSQLTDRLLLSTVGYYGGGRGGGTGTLGSSPVRVPFDGGDGSPFANLPWRWDWDATIARNRSEAQQDEGGLYESRTILRNSRNDQDTWGAISKLTFNTGDGVTAEVGVDARTASIRHYREVRDLLGGDYFVDDADDFAGERRVGLGDKVDYYNENNVNWIGGFAQAEVVRGAFTAFGMTGVTSTSYAFEDFFNEDPNVPGQTLQLDSGALTGWQVKGGALYNVTEAVDVFANAGYIAKTPIFDGVINDVTGTLNPDPQNEDIVSVELGASFRTRTLALKLAAYHTNWSNRTVNRGVNVLQDDGSVEEAVVFLRGVEELHQGLEAELAFQPLRQVRFDASVGIGDWTYTGDVTGDFQTADRQTNIPVFIGLDGLKVGDQPQTQLAYGLTVQPLDGLNLQVLGRTYGRHYAAFDPISRALADVDGDGQADDLFGAEDEDEFNVAPDRVQSWQVPGFTVFDLNFGYRIPVTGLPVGIELTANVFNVFDATYIQDATDNSSFSSWDQDHDADDAEVYLGLPRRFNVGARLSF